MEVDMAEKVFNELPCQPLHLFVDEAYAEVFVIYFLPVCALLVTEDWFEKSAEKSKSH